MPGSDPQTGDVYYYPYVWKRQGRFADPEKDRPCCVALRFTAGAYRGANTFLLALTQSGVPDGGYGIVVPVEIVATLRRLDRHAQTYLVTSEFNADTSEHPSFEDCEFLGRMPRWFMKDVLNRLIEHIKSGSGEVNRTGTD